LSCQTQTAWSGDWRAWKAATPKLKWRRQHFFHFLFYASTPVIVLIFFKILLLVSFSKLERTKADDTNLPISNT
jgi:hypothetical protein